MTPMPVAFLLPSFAAGGAERVLMMLMTALPPARFAPALVVLAAAGPLANGVPSRIAVHDLGEPRLRRALPALLRCLRRLKPRAVVSTFGYLNLALLALRPLLPAGTRLVMREANTPSQSLPQGRWPPAMRLGYRLLYPTADAVLCQHRRTAREMAAHFGVARERLHALANPVDVDHVRAAAASPRRAPGSGPRFVAAGRLVRQKGFDRLLEMFAPLPADAHLTLLGDGPDRAALIARAEALGLARRVRFAGFVTEPWPHYAGADACLIPSRWEGMPNVALEALACGTPVIAMRRAGGIAELGAQAEAVCVADDEADFVAAMAGVTSSPVTALRPSLLPPAYHLDEIARAFTGILAAL